MPSPGKSPKRSPNSEPCWSSFRNSTCGIWTNGASSLFRQNPIPRALPQHPRIPAIQIGVLQRATRQTARTLLFTEKLGLRFLNKRLGGAICSGVAYDPIYSPEHLRERGQFVSVIELTFKAVKQT